MNCDDLELRLYDEDCRHALLGETPIPRDVATHLEICPACRRVWSEAATDTLRLTHDLPLEAPPSVLTLPQPLEREKPSPRAMIGWAELGWGLTAGAVAATLCGLLPVPIPWCQWTAFWTGATLGLTAATLDRAGITLFPEWT